MELSRLFVRGLLETGLILILVSAVWCVVTELLHRWKSSRIRVTEETSGYIPTKYVLEETQDVPCRKVDIETAVEEKKYVEQTQFILECRAYVEYNTDQHDAPVA